MPPVWYNAYVCISKEDGMEDSKKLSFSEWFENIWYHYKWMIIFIGMLVLFLIISLFQFLATDDPDVDILHVGPMYLSVNSVEQLEETLGELSADYNGDGEFKLNLLDITVNKFGNEDAGIDPTNYDKDKSALQRFQTEIRAGDAVIYALDKQFFDICIEEALLAPLNEIIDDAYMPENTVKDKNGTAYGVYISDLDVRHLSGFSSFPDTAILCLRRSPAKDAIKYGRTEEVWEGNRKTFVNIIKHRDDDKKAFDNDVLCVGSKEMSEETENAISAVLAEFSKDYNGDGEYSCAVMPITVETKGDKLAEDDKNLNAVNKFEAELYTGDAMIYLVDKQVFDICAEGGFLTPFSELFDADNMPEGVISGCGIYLDRLDIYKLDGFKDLPAKTVVCLRRSPEKETLKYGRSQAVWEGNRETFVNLLKYLADTDTEIE